MTLLLDTHLLLWAAAEPHKLPSAALAEIENSDNVLLFSVASLWEVAIKRGLGRSDFMLDPDCCAVSCSTTATTNWPLVVITPMGWSACPQSTRIRLIAS